MPYYPKSQIKTNLYTSGGEYSLAPPNYSSLQNSYIGYYHKLSNGRIYTGKNPTDSPYQILYVIENLIPYDDKINQITLDFTTIEPNADQLTIQYNSIPKITTFKNRLLPFYNPTTPTQTDYELGVFTRYFCKKNNEPRYIETDKKTFNSLSAKSTNIAWDLYSPISTLWYITGDKTTAAKANKGLVNLIETQQKWYGFPQYFKDQYLKYYLAT
jgi:hypothetical protein